MLKRFYGFVLCSLRGRISLDEYADNINDAIAFIKGGSVKTVKKMEEQMLECSENLQFEEAAKLRDRIKAIKNLEEKQR